MRPNGSSVLKVFGSQVDGGGFIETGGATTVRRFDVLGARSVMILWKCTSGTPTITVGGYVHPLATRDATLTNFDCLSKSGGASVAAGQYFAVYPSNAAGDFATPASELVLPLQELDISVAGNVVGFEARAIVLY